MNGFGEIRTCLVLLFAAFLIVKTRARFIYQPNPVVHCLNAKVPCSGHHSEDACKEYCQENGYTDGRCNGFCCLCFGQRVFPHRPSTDGISGHPIRNPFVEASINKPIFGINHNKRPVVANNEKREIGASLKETNSLQPILGNNLSEPMLSSGEICLSPSCVKTANDILVNMNENVDPCENFYEFACGNFERQTAIPDDKGEVTLIGSLTDNLHQQVRTLLEESQANSQSSQLAKKLYHSCMRSDILEQKGLEPMHKIVREMGGWPVLDKEWKWTANWKWTDAVVKLKSLGLAPNTLISVTVTPDLKNPKKHIITMGEPLIPVHREQLPNRVFMSSYRKKQMDLAILMGANPETALKDMEKVYNFEIALANISLPKEQSRAHPLKFYHPMRISELERQFAPVNWLKFLQDFFPEDVHIKSSDVVNVANPSHLVNLLRLVEMTDQRTLVNYLVSQGVSSMVQYTNEGSRRILQEFAFKTTGQRVRPSKPKECTDLVTRSLAHAVGLMYIRQHFNQNSRAKAEHMFKDIHNAFESVLDEATWMDSSTRRMAHGKSKAMTSLIGFPEEMNEESNIMQLYEGLELNDHEFFENVLNISKSAFAYSLRKLRKPVDENAWVATGKPAVVNAYYNPLKNSIQFPAGILQGHFFKNERPEFMNYGAIGWVYGHELIHGFDDQGSRFDLNGELKDWWHPLTKQRYHSKTRCFVEEYGKFSVQDLVTNTPTHLNSIVSLGENIADNGGIKLAYKGYQQWVQRNGQEKKLPGLDFNPNQLFWISAANNWCSKFRPQALQHKLRTAIHPPGLFRVLGSFSNSKEFSKDFNCPVGSKMNPIDKCTLW